MLKKILGLDLGTNSIGWALIEQDDKARTGAILRAGSRIIPMSQETLGKFDSGVTESPTAERRNFRSIRRLRERHLLRRERLHRVLHLLGFLPEHYAAQIDFEKRVGQFRQETEPKLPYFFNADTKQNEFLFISSFAEMLNDFKEHQPALVGEGRKVPYDWTIYYLRKKALTKQVSKEELAWLLLHFNQKRGYYQLRGEDEERTDKQESYHSLRVVKVEATDDKKGDEVWYKVHLENGWIYPRKSRTPLEWEGKVKDFIVTTELNEDGSIKKDKDGKERRSFRAPGENDWGLLKKKTEQEIEQSEKTVGAYIYDTLLQKPAQKIKGALVRVVERRFYKSELQAILDAQKIFHPELNDAALYQACVSELYEYNEAHQNSLAPKDFTHFFLNDIIFYQRPLKSKKSLISDCPFEFKSFIKEGKKETVGLKCIAKSHPLFQEFRLWQFIQNLRVYEREAQVNGKLQTDLDVTQHFFASNADFIALFDWLNDRKEVDQKAFFKSPVLKLKKGEVERYRWNYVEDKLYPCNETRAQIKSRLDKLKEVHDSFLTPALEEALWHILYSVDDKLDIEKALNTFAQKHGLPVTFIEAFKKFPPFKKEYGSYSAKAIKKLLPLMRAGKYWQEAAIHPQTADRIQKLLDGEWDEAISNRVRDKALHLQTVADFCGLPLWLASYVVYNRHSEAADTGKWESSEAIEKYLREEFKQHSLRNPIVEGVITETLRVVKDIWKQYGKGEKGFFSEIHVELGREMKNPADKRKEMTAKIAENEATNLRIKALLQELLNDKEVENVRPYSPSQQELLKLYEEGALMAAEEVPEYIIKIAKQAQPSSSDLVRYKLWLQQKYRSPYTGDVIPLNKLFTRAYDIEHIIPQSRYFDDSFSNKVICEVEVNRDKDNCTAYEYIKNNRGKKIELSMGRETTLFTVEAYEHFIKTHYGGNRGKLKRLLMDDIPEAFIQRQLNDSRYISKAVKTLLSKIVRKDDEQEATSTNVIACNGAITSRLKEDWGLNAVWNEIITPRFERLNRLTNSQKFGSWTDKGGKIVFQTEVPLELQKGFSKKRIDHRHHALDAIVIACASRNHINYLNNENANGKDPHKPKRHDLRNQLRRIEPVSIEKIENGQRVKRTIQVAREFYKPWESFTQDTKSVLQSMVVSFKQNVRVINKTTNAYQAWTASESGSKAKALIKQTTGQNWAIRKPMHKDTVSGLVKLRMKKVVSLTTALNDWQNIVNKDLRLLVKELMEKGYDKKALQKFFAAENNLWKGVDISKVEVFYWDIDKDGVAKNVASRVRLDESFSSDKINSITDSGIRKILLRHLSRYDEVKNGENIEHPELAFSPDGLDMLHQNLTLLNDGKPHQPIYKVRIFEPLGNKFPVGQTGNKTKKFVESAKGTNLFFAVYADDKGKRCYETVSLNVVIERQKQELSSVPEFKDDSRLLFSLSPNDLIYLPNEEESLPSKLMFTKTHLDRLFKVVSFTGNRLYAIPASVAKSIVDKVEFTQLNKLEFYDEQSIKDSCIKLQVNRLGDISIKDKVSLLDAPGLGFSSVSIENGKPIAN